MKLNWKMILRRKTTSLLVVAFLGVITIFLLTYPRIIDRVEQELENAYDAVEVSCWIRNTKGYSEPNIPEKEYQPLMDSELVGEYEACSIAGIHIVSAYHLQHTYDELCMAAESLRKQYGDLSYFDDDTKLRIMPAAVAAIQPVPMKFYGLNSVTLSNELARQKDHIQWADGYSLDCLQGSEWICIIPDDYGYAPGEWIPVRLRPTSKENESIYADYQLMVAGVYPGKAGANTGGYCPLETLRALFGARSWKLTLQKFQFESADNRRLEELKDLLRELKLSVPDDGIRSAAIDDRILEGTVAPIQSNLSMLERLYKFFFIVVVAIGFFLCFLLAKNRKPEYAVMRMLGESTAKVTFKALLEQIVLCVCGILLGTLVLTIGGQESLNAVTCGIILVCYTLGATIAVLLTVRVNVMEILRDKE